MPTSYYSPYLSPEEEERRRQEEQSTYQDDVLDSSLYGTDGSVSGGEEDNPLYSAMEGFDQVTGGDQPTTQQTQQDQTYQTMTAPGVPPPPPPAPPPPGDLPGMEQQADPMASAYQDYESLTGDQEFDVGGWNQQMADFVSQQLQTPSRYDTELVQQGQQVLEDALNRSRREGMRRVGEQYASRGLTSSSLEAEQMADLEAQLMEQYRRGLFDLGREQANTYAQDVSTAGQLGLGLGQQAADYGLRRDELEAEERMFGQELTQRESEFARNFGLSEREFQAEQEQFAQQMAEQTASRLQQESQFARELAQEDTRMAMEQGLRTRALDLQEQGMTLDDAFRQAQLQQEEELRSRALDLEERGLESDEAYRYAALAQDERFQQRALDLEEQGMAIDEALRQAELDLQRELGTERLALDWAELDALRGWLGLDEEGEGGGGEGGGGTDEGSIEPGDDTSPPYPWEVETGELWEPEEGAFDPEADTVYGVPQDEWRQLLMMATGDGVGTDVSREAIQKAIEDWRQQQANQQGAEMTEPYLDEIRDAIRQLFGGGETTTTTDENYPTNDEFLLY